MSRTIRRVWGRTWTCKEWDGKLYWVSHPYQLDQVCLAGTWGWTVTKHDRLATIGGTLLFNSLKDARRAIKDAEVA